MWNTNFPLWQDGSWSERVRFWPISKNINAAENLAVQSWEARLPLQAIIADNATGKLPATKEGLSVSRKGVLVTAFGADTDGNKGTLLRMWEQAGISSNVTIKLPAGMKVKYAAPVNLRGEKTGNRIVIKNNSITFLLQKFSPASFVLE